MSSEEGVVVARQNRKVELTREVNGPLDVGRSSGKSCEFSMGEISDDPSALK